MQKKIIALAVAAVASGAAFAQTNVTISGNMDLSYKSSKSQASASSTTTTNSWGTANSASTSNVALTATEDLGNGLKVKVYIESNPTFGTSSSSGFSNAPNYIQLSGKFGAVSMGYINNFALTAATTAQPFGTAMGGGYGGALQRLNGAGTDTADGKYKSSTTGARDVRHNNTLQYVTPNMAGFTAGIQLGAKNNKAGSEPGLGQVGLNYANGPIKVAYAYSKIAWDAGVGGADAGLSVTHNLLGANFSLGAATLYGGYTSSRNSANTVDSRSWNVALKYAFTGALSGAINILRDNDQLATDVDRSLTGLGLDYAMSKRTTAYFRFENGDTDRSKAGANKGNYTNYAVGMRHTF